MKKNSYHLINGNTVTIPYLTVKSTAFTPIVHASFEHCYKHLTDLQMNQLGNVTKITFKNYFFIIMKHVWLNG